MLHETIPPHDWPVGAAVGQAVFASLAGPSPHVLLRPRDSAPVPALGHRSDSVAPTLRPDLCVEEATVFIPVLISLRARQMLNCSHRVRFPPWGEPLGCRIPPEFSLPCHRAPGQLTRRGLNNVPQRSFGVFMNERPSCSWSPSLEVAAGSSSALHPKNWQDAGL